MIRSSSGLAPRPVRTRFLGIVAIAATTLVVAAHATLAGGLAADPPPRVEPGPMKAIIRAHPDGRAERDVWDKWMMYRPHHGGWPEDIQPGLSVTEQESVLAADDAQVVRRGDGARGSLLRADRMLLNLPEGSRLSAVFLGDEVSVMPGESETHVTVQGGEVRIVDQAGVVRVVAQAGATGGILRLVTALDRDEVAFTATAADPEGRSVPVEVRLDLETGIPAEEAQPPHGAERWELFTPDEPGRGTYVLKMQWVYDAWEMKRRHGGT